MRQRERGNRRLRRGTRPLARPLEHRQVVRTVADGDCSRRRDAEFGRRAKQRSRLVSRVTTGCCTVPAIRPLHEVESVGDDPVETERRRQPVRRRP